MMCGCTHMYSQPAILHDEAFSASGSVVYVRVTTVEQCDFSALSHISPQHLFACTCIISQTICQHVCSIRCIIALGLTLHHIQAIQLVVKAAL